MRGAATSAIALALLAQLLAPVPAIGATLYVMAEGEATGAGTEDDPYNDLQHAIDAASSGDVIQILAGVHTASPEPLVEPLCGNCEDHRTSVRATVGFRVKGKALHLRGSGAAATVLHTAAGYGIFFEDSLGSSVSDLTITGGKRDDDGNATDAAVVVRRSTVTIEHVDIVDNTDTVEGVVVGIGGVMGREGAVMHIASNRITNNGWDGVALYRGAVAVIADNEICDGRGAGIGITWDSAALVLRNRISGYWKGIGTFGSSRAVVRNNAVFDNLGWGLVATGESYMEAANNVVARNGNCGVAIWSDEATGLLTNNIIVENGWREEWVCPCVGVWFNSVAAEFPITHNNVWNNVTGNYMDIEDPTGTDGNISLDPLFADSLDFHLREGSPAADAGNPIFTDPDGGLSDMGVYGGPQAP
jgi:hypothetical protein